MSDADISGIASITFCQVTDLNFPQLIACFNYLAHVLALGTKEGVLALKRLGGERRASEQKGVM